MHGHVYRRVYSMVMSEAPLAVHMHRHVRYTFAWTCTHMGVDMCTLLSGTMAVSASSYLGTAGHGLGMCRVPLEGSRRDGSDGYQRVYTEALDMPSAMPMSRNRTRI